MYTCAVLLGIVISQVILITFLLIGVYAKNTNARCKSRKRLDGKTVIVTGGTTGMGLELATEFATRGARVIVACPFIVEGASARKEIVDNTGNDNVVFKPLDLGSLSSVRQFAADIKKTEDRLDILLNNAGIGLKADNITADGMNLIMQVNFYGHFLLTLLLLPLLRKTGKPSEPSRIVNTSSILHKYGKTDIENMNKPKTGYWSMVQAYGNSKLCFVLFSRELANRLEGSHVVVNSLDPGSVGTTIFHQGGQSGRILSFLCRYLAKSPWEGAQTALHLSLDDKAGEVSGEFFKECKSVRAAPQAYDDKLAGKLWLDSMRLVKLSEDELQQCFRL